MNNALIDNTLRICAALHSHHVEYMIVGGTAVALHGFFRVSTNAAGVPVTKPDLDFWYNPTYPNYYKLLDALASLEINVTSFKAEKSPDPKRSFFKYDFEEFTLDFLPRLKADLVFRNAFESAVTINYQNVPISFLAYEDLIKDKLTNPRKKDIEDVDELKKRRENKS